MAEIQLHKTKDGGLFLFPEEVSNFLEQGKMIQKYDQVCFSDNEQGRFILTHQKETGNYVLSKKCYSVGNERVVEQYLPSGVLKKIELFDGSAPNNRMIENYVNGHLVSSQQIHHSSENGQKIFRFSHRSYKAGKGFWTRKRILIEKEGRVLFNRYETRDFSGKLVEVKLEKDGKLVLFDLNKKVPATFANAVRKCFGLSPKTTPKVKKIQYLDTIAGMGRFETSKNLLDLPKQRLDLKSERATKRDIVAVFRSKKLQQKTRD